jgi:hypothetical protein
MQQHMKVCLPFIIFLFDILFYFLSLEYKDNSDLISRNTSVVVARRIRGALESLTPSSNQKLVVSSDDIVNE